MFAHEKKHRLLSLSHFVLLLSSLLFLLRPFFLLFFVSSSTKALSSIPTADSSQPSCEKRSTGKGFLNQIKLFLFASLRVQKQAMCFSNIKCFRIQLSDRKMTHFAPMPASSAGVGHVGDGGTDGKKRGGEGRLQKPALFLNEEEEES